MTKVKEGDMITAVNGVSSASSQMLLKIKSVGKGEELKFVIDPGAESFGGEQREGQRFRDQVKVYAELQKHFAALDIAPTSSDEAIRQHYRRLARKWHPDKNATNVSVATEKFQAINTAYSAIKAKR